MRLFCKLLGHKAPKGWNNNPSYLTPKFVAIDGLNTVHYSLHANCVHCDKEYIVGYMHMPKMPEWMTKLLIEKDAK